MKRIYFLLLLAGCFGGLQAFSQSTDRIYKPFKVDVSLGYAVPQGAGSKGGVVFAAEPKYAVAEHLALGLRMEAALMERGYVSPDGQQGSGTVKATASYVATADYYFSNNTVRPFAGAGIGWYGVASYEVSNNGSVNEEIAAQEKFGALARAGFEAAHFRLGLEYNFIGKTYDRIKNGYFSIKFGVCIGGGRYSK